MSVKRALSVFLGVTVVIIFVGVSRGVGGFVLRPFDVSLLLALALITAAVLLKGRFGKFSADPILMTIVALYGYIFLNGLVFSSPVLAIKELIQGVEFIFLLLLIARITNHPERRWKFLKTLFWGFGMMSVIAAMWHIAQGEFASYKHLGDTKVAFSFFALFAYCFYFYSADERKDKAVLGGVLLVALILLLLSGERKGWVAFVGALLVLSFAHRKARAASRRSTNGHEQKNPIWRFLPAAVLIGGVAALLAPRIPYLQTQFNSFYDLLSLIRFENINYEEASSSSNKARLYLLLFSIRSLFENPIFGIGTGRFKQVLGEVAAAEGGVVFGAHSEYQRMAVEGGIIGLGLYLLIWWLMFKRGRVFIKRAKPQRRLVASIVLGLVALGAIINMFLGGGGLNTVYMILAAGLLMGLREEHRVRNLQEAS